MGQAAWHWARAKHHYDFAVDLHRTLPTYSDWAAVGLFYSALHIAHAALDGETGLPKDERHPRKHSAPKNAKVGGRGLSQLVRDLYRPAHFQYRSLFEASVRTRYDMTALASPQQRLLADHKVVHDHIHGVITGQGVALTAFR
jgi:hypothetical protein